MSQVRSGYSYMYNEGPSPFIPLMLIGMVVMWIALPWYFSYEPAVEEVQEQWNLVLIILPVLLLLAIIYLAYNSSADMSGANVLKYIMPQSDPSSIHRVGGSPIGLGILLLIVLTMVWYHSDFIDSWNPLLRN